MVSAVFEPASEGGFTCHFEEWPAVFSEGDTMAEARANLADTLQLEMDHNRAGARARSV
jgi:predicted RNase H-like HicB family nuclease